MIGIKSDVGNVRKLNEDYAHYIQREEYKVFVVADGMGGHNAGEIASEMAVNSVIDYIDKNFDLKDINILKKAVEYANSKVYEFGHSKDEYNGMGTTLTACLITNEFIRIANVGDSSCFGIREGIVKKLTIDHSLVQELVDLGTITEQEAQKHPQRNIITRAIGTKKWVDIDIFEIPIGRFKLFMLCSDGLTNEVNNEDVTSILEGEMDLQSVCDRLVDLAKSRGGRDNITVMLFGGEV